MIDTCKTNVRQSLLSTYFENANAFSATLLIQIYNVRTWTILREREENYRGFTSTKMGNKKSKKDYIECKCSV